MTDRPPPITDTEYAIQATDLGVQYSLRFSRKKSMQRTLSQLLTREPVEQFWALRHVDLRVVHGESLAVTSVEERGGLLVYQAAGREVAEAELSDTISFSKPEDRLLIGQ